MAYIANLLLKLPLSSIVSGAIQIHLWLLMDKVLAFLRSVQCFDTVGWMIWKGIWPINSLFSPSFSLANMQWLWRRRPSTESWNTVCMLDISVNKHVLFRCRYSLQGFCSKQQWSCNRRVKVYIERFSSRKDMKLSTHQKY